MGVLEVTKVHVWCDTPGCFNGVEDIDVCAEHVVREVTKIHGWQYDEAAGTLACDWCCRKLDLQPGVKKADSK